MSLAELTKRSLASKSIFSAGDKLDMRQPYTMTHTAEMITLKAEWNRGSSLFVEPAVRRNVVPFIEELSVAATVSPSGPQPACSELGRVLGYRAVLVDFRPEPLMWGKMRAHGNQPSCALRSGATHAGPLSLYPNPPLDAGGRAVPRSARDESTLILPQSLGKRHLFPRALNSRVPPPARRRTVTRTLSTERREAGKARETAVGRQTLKRPCVRSRESLRPPSQRDERHAGQASGTFPGSGLGGVTNAATSPVRFWDRPSQGDLCPISYRIGSSGREERVMELKFKYPIRCRIIDVTGQWKHGLELATPDVSRPHIGKLGLAEEEGETVKITLDDGTVIYGYECWWEPLQSVKAAKRKP